ncbi:MAG: EAL domain-containing protein [Myxococcales bacterium]|nr:EAL domain-containing protein [Myxococcales bacterium]
MVRRAFARVLAQSGFEVLTAENGADALELIRKHDFSAIISDISMPDMDGIALLQAVRDIDVTMPVVLATGAPSIDSAADAVELGALNYLRKPVAPEQLVRAVETAVERRHEASEAVVETQRTQQRLATLRGDFQAALDQLHMAYQPIVDVSTQQVFGYEALLRTNHAPMRNPLAFIEASETLDAIWTLGRSVRRRIATDSLQSPHGAQLFVNLHPRDLFDEELVNPRSPLSRIARHVILEVTERASLERLDEVKEQIRRLRELGFRIAIDDLGAGYASLSAIALVEPEVVKLDMSLVRDIHEVPTKQRLVRAMTSLSKELGAIVVAEGVENERERDCLVELGCSLLQGYFFARPQPGFVAWP